MVDITHKINTLREATAIAIVRTSSEETIKAIQRNSVPKGNVFEMAKAAGLLGVKKTPDLLPDCHPMPIEYTGIEYEINGHEIKISMTVKTIYKTGVEVEAMHGASIVALTIYDMLKPIDKNVEIGTIKLQQKKGGKSSYKIDAEGLTAKVVVCSDTISKGKGKDKAGKAIVSKLEELGIKAEKVIIPDEAEEITSALIKAETELVIFTGGTGVGPRDVTPETIESLLDLRLKGVEEQMRNYGQQRMPYAMLSRSVAGIVKDKVVLALPGSTKGAAECMDAIFPHVLHIFKVIEGKRHD
ncbi:bifunctional molybdenum cofactor biosynthesis protein MoaC/MoaB [Christiangramia forsetii]|uniref:Molybdopterin adenylyltransferase n=2 Tax=Christiangramia forsetii TaxID=411153 RepID=A0LYJ1_CHRFK|nr:bifunctional molybdenum cofactor biosynthesis protein MoaC/MoaB [Christiangramia forsetii]GGG34087.1 bifunctional molybdenum cofactor biosynthesis protein MoaC/MoaB [Christiangramia forsetii]CAL65436.1 molybdenum cofactor biosynthesis bifunctional protein [Christiangramia forsetii KT0803]